MGTTPNITPPDLTKLPGMGTPADRLFVGDPPRLRLQARRDVARATLEAQGGTLLERFLRGRSRRVDDPMAASLVRLCAMGRPRGVVDCHHLLGVAPTGRPGTATGEDPDGRKPGPDERSNVDGDHWLHLRDIEVMRSMREVAELIEAVRREGPRSDEPEVARMRSVVVRPMTVAQAVTASATGPAGRRALIRLIADEAVHVRGGWSIDDSAVVEPAADPDGPP